VHQHIYTLFSYDMLSIFAQLFTLSIYAVDQADFQFYFKYNFLNIGVYILKIGSMYKK
jgi:hypothetical protein